MRNRGLEIAILRGAEFSHRPSRILGCHGAQGGSLSQIIFILRGRSARPLGIFEELILLFIYRYFFIYTNFYFIFYFIFIEYYGVSELLDESRKVRLLSEIFRFNVSRDRPGDEERIAISKEKRNDFNEISRDSDEAKRGFTLRQRLARFRYTSSLSRSLANP